MKRFIRISLISLLYFSSASYASVENNNKNNAVKIMNNLTNLCETEGMLACKPYIKGIDFLFSYMQEVNKTHDIKKKLTDFIKKRYPNNNGGLNIEMLEVGSFIFRVKFTLNQFVNSITKVTSVKNGFDILLDDNSRLLLKKDNDNWVAVFPSTIEKQYSKQIESFYRLVKLKGTILTYRMLESEIANITKDEFQHNINSDIAPIVVTLLPDKKTPGMLKWLSKDIDEVFKFYMEIQTIRDMKAHIKSAHNL